MFIIQISIESLKKSQQTETHKNGHEKCRNSGNILANGQEHLETFESEPNNGLDRIAENSNGNFTFTDTKTNETQYSYSIISILSFTKNNTDCTS